METKEEEKKTSVSVIMFTDIKDFTLKTSLLTNKQVEKILVDHSNLVTPFVERHHGKIVKVIGDAFMIIFSHSRDALDCSLSLQKAAAVYNQEKKLNLFKIELRISLDKGEVIKTQTLEGDDYFGEAVNTSSRLEAVTPENTILMTKKVYDDVKDIAGFTIIGLGKTSFRGILYEADIYKALYDEREIRDFKAGKLSMDDLRGSYVDKYRVIISETDKIIFNCACVAALLGIQPIPFLDNFSIVPLYIYMLLKISESYGETLNIDTGFKLIQKIIAAVGISYLTVHLSIGVTKMVFPIIAGYTVIPINFGVTYGLGKIFSMHYYTKNFGVTLSNKEMRNLFRDKKLVGKDIAKTQKDYIVTKGKEVKKQIEKGLKDISNKLKGKE